MIVIDIFGNDNVDIDTKSIDEEEALQRRKILEEQQYREDILRKAPELQLVVILWQKFCRNMYVCKIR